MKATMALKANLPEFFEKYREIHAKLGRPTAITVEADYHYAGYYIAENIQYCLGVYRPGVPIEWVREDLA